MTLDHSPQGGRGGEEQAESEIGDGAGARKAPGAGQMPTALLVDVRGLARMTSLSVRSIWRMVSAGAIPKPLKVGGRALWRVDDIRNWVEEGCQRMGR